MAKEGRKEVGWGGVAVTQETSAAGDVYGASGGVDIGGDLWLVYSMVDFM